MASGRSPGTCGVRTLGSYAIHSYEMLYTIDKMMIGQVKLNSVCFTTVRRVQAAKAPSERRL
jgi:hypothetical protein